MVSPNKQTKDDSISKLIGWNNKKKNLNPKNLGRKRVMPPAAGKTHWPHRIQLSNHSKYTTTYGGRWKIAAVVHGFLAKSQVARFNYPRARPREWPRISAQSPLDSASAADETAEARTTSVTAEAEAEPERGGWVVVGHVGRDRDGGRDSEGSNSTVDWYGRGRRSQWQSPEPIYIYIYI